MRGSFWQFHAGDLRPGTAYELSLTSTEGRSLCQPWKLSTMPSPDELPGKLRLLIYSCAGGHDLFSTAHTGLEFLPAAVRQRLLRRGLSFAPDALIANGDHVYWDLLAPRAAPRLGASKAALEYARFDRDAPVLGGANESALLRAAGEQLLHCTARCVVRRQCFSCKTTTIISTTTKRAMRRLPSRPTISCCNPRGPATPLYPNSCDLKISPGIPGSDSPDQSSFRPDGLSESFGTLRYGRLAEVLLYDVRRTVTLAGPTGAFVAPDVEVGEDFAPLRGK